MKKVNFKQVLLLIGVLLFSMLAFRAPEDEKVITFTMKRGEALEMFEAMEFSRNAIQTSTAPAVQVNEVVGRLSRAMQRMGEQYNAQVDTTKKAPIKK